MAERIVRLNPRRGFFFGYGINLVNPERPLFAFPEGFEVPGGIIRGIKSGALIDVNKNILVDVVKDSESFVNQAIVNEENNEQVSNDIDKKINEETIEEEPVIIIEEKEITIERRQGNKGTRGKRK